jgi:glycosyltransferase involved in cell wall biosynthesis
MMNGNCSEGIIDMKQICIDVRMAFHSGIGTYIRNIVQELKKTTFRLKLLATPMVLDKWHDINQQEVIIFKSPIYTLKEQLLYPFKIPPVDLYWSTHYNVPFLPIRAKKRLVSIYDVCHLAYNAHQSFHKRFYAKHVMHQAVTRSDHIITISDFSKQEIIRFTKARPDSISTIPLAVNREEFFPISNHVLLSHVKQLYKLSDYYILFVGNFLPHKNLKTLLKAWSFVHQRYPHFELVLVGKRGVKVEGFLDPSVRILQNVIQSHLPVLYQMAHLFIFPSLYEGFGLPPLEAMAMRCPVVASDAASLPEVCGDACLYTDPLDEKKMAEQICLVIEDKNLRDQLNRKADLHLKSFSWKKTAEDHIKIIESLV